MWSFRLILSADMFPIAELKKAANKSLTLSLNKPGSANFTYPMDDELSGLIEPIATGIIAYKDNIPVWSGMIIGPLNEDAETNTMTIPVMGWLDKLNHRILRSDLPTTGKYEDIDDGTILFDLLQRANDFGPLPSYDYEGTTHTADTSTFIEEGTKNYPVEEEAPRTAKFDKYTNIGAEIDKLTNIENGCDIEVHPITRELNIWRRKMTDRTEVIMGYNAPPFNLASFKPTRDTSQMVNYFRAIGRFNDGLAEDTPSQELYGLIEETGAMTDVSDPENTILPAFAGAEVAVRSTPRVTYDVAPFSQNIFQPFVDYQLGDKIYISANKGHWNLAKQAVRIFGLTLNIDNEGNEKVSNLQLSL